MDFGNPIQPIQVDTKVRFSSIGGLKNHIRCLREMVLFPLMYPELFRKFNTRPAKGVLFHGPPGTGKTLLARALANECSLVGGRKVSFFMRKGADVMNRYYGESERNLRLVFQQASKMKPSIIFFDEVDALAPIRNMRDGQTHASVVATLLAEMDGLCDRGEVIVIGATNRPDAMDPAVRRAGRFDRELFFPPPEFEARKEILQIHTKDWQPPLSDDTLNEIARITVGYLGSDMKALCSEAVLKAVKRVYPQIYETEYKLLVDAKNVQVTTADIQEAMNEILPSGNRSCPVSARSLPPHCIPLLQSQLDAAASLLRKAFPPPSERSSGVFMVCGECAETHLAPALLAQLEHCIVKELSVATLHSGSHSSPQQVVISIFSDCRRSDRPCVLFVPDLFTIWSTSDSRQGAVILQQLWKTRPVGDNTLLLATCGDFDKLPSELKDIFPYYKDCVYRMRQPTDKEVMDFLQPVITELPLVPPIVYKKEMFPELPRAPERPGENPEEMERRKRREFESLQLMKITLRSICRTLSADRRFYKFSSPVNVNVVKDYLDRIKKPMDLQTLQTKIDLNQCYCAKEFLDDIDLICANALLYNLDKHSSEKRHRQDVCSLHSEAYSMVSEEVDTNLELECQIIARRRRDGGTDFDDFENDYIYFAKMDGAFNHPLLKQDKGNAKKCRKRRNGVGLGEDCERKRPRTAPGHSKEEHTTDSNDEATSCPKPKFPKIPRPDPNKKLIPIKDDKHPIITCEKQKNNTNDKQNKVFENTTQVMINKAELDILLNNNIERLRRIGLNALLELHSQLSRVVHEYATTNERTALPTELGAIVSRYIQLSKF